MLPNEVNRDEDRDSPAETRQTDPGSEWHSRSAGRVPRRADTEHPAGTRILWGGRAREIRFDPTKGQPALPSGGPHMIIVGPELE